MHIFKKKNAIEISFMKLLIETHFVIFCRFYNEILSELETHWSYASQEESNEILLGERPWEIIGSFSIKIT